MTQPYNKPLPVPQQENEFYWEKCREHELWLRRCNSCNHTYFYPRDFCPDCHTKNVTWEKTDGHARLYTFAICHRPPTPAFQDVSPLITAIVEFESGARMPTNLVGIEPDPTKIQIGMELEVVFEDATDAISLPKFKPVAG